MDGDYLDASQMHCEFTELGCLLLSYYPIYNPKANHMHYDYFFGIPN